MSTDISVLNGIVKNLKESILPKKNHFHEETRVKTALAIKKFNEKSCLSAGLYIHFKKIGESTMWTWTHVTIGGHKGPTVIELIADKNNHRIESSFKELKPFLKKEFYLPKQGDLFA